MFRRRGMFLRAQRLRLSRTENVSTGLSLSRRWNILNVSMGPMTNCFYGSPIEHNVSTGLHWRGSVKMFRREVTSATSKHPALDTRPNICSSCAPTRCPWKHSLEMFRRVSNPVTGNAQNRTMFQRVCSGPQHENVSTGAARRIMFPRGSYAQTRGNNLACRYRPNISQI